MKLLFVRPPMPEEAFPQSISTELGILASISARLGHSVDICDLNALRLTMDAVRVEVSAEQWDLVIVSTTFQQYKYLKQLIPIIKSRQIAPLIAIGELASKMPVEMMSWIKEIDFAFVGEYALTFDGFLEKKDSEDWENVDGLAYRSGDEIVLTKPRQRNDELDELPYPAYNFMPMTYYFDPRYGKRRISVDWQHGRSLFGEEPKFHGPKYCVDHLLYLRKKYGVELVSIFDEDMGSYPDRVYAFCNEFERAGLVDVIRFAMVGDATKTTKEMLRRLREVGLDHIVFKEETASDSVLNWLDRQCTVQQMQQVVDWCRDIEIGHNFPFKCGFPDETVDDILATMNFARFNNVKVLTSVYRPQPGTSHFEKSRSKIEDYCGGDLEKFLLEFASPIAANLSPWNDIELLGIQQLIAMNDDKRLIGWAEKRGLTKNATPN